MNRATSVANSFIAVTVLISAYALISAGVSGTAQDRTQESLLKRVNDLENPLLNAQVVDGKRVRVRAMEVTNSVPSNQEAKSKNNKEAAAEGQGYASIVFSTAARGPECGIKIATTLPALDGTSNEVKRFDVGVGKAGGDNNEAFQTSIGLHADNGAGGARRTWEVSNRFGERTSKEYIDDPDKLEFVLLPREKTDGDGYFQINFPRNIDPQYVCGMLVSVSNGNWHTIEQSDRVANTFWWNGNGIFGYISQRDNVGMPKRAAIGFANQEVQVILVLKK